MPLLYGDGLSPPERLPGPPLDPAAIIAIISEYYQFLSRLPHISSSWLHFPPEFGWTDIDEETLRSRGRSDRTIDLLKQLPYFQKPASSPGDPYEDRTVRLSPDDLSVAYHVGQTWRDVWEEKCPTPGNVLWLTEMDDWDGTALLLDVDAASITEFSFQSHGPSLFPTDDLAPHERWMASPTWSIGLYFAQARRYYERLLWIPRPAMRGDHWPIMVRTGKQALDALVGSDDDFINAPMDEDFSDGDSTDNGDDYDDDEEYLEGEVDQLMDDAQPDGTLPTADNTERVMSRPVNRPPASPEPDPKTVREEQTWSELIAIYSKNDWPRENFDKTSCITELLEWGEMERARSKNAFFGRS